MTLLAPAPLADDHDLTEFDSGVAELDDWLRKRARSNQATGASRTFVLYDGNRVVGYYALATGAVAQKDAPGRIKRNMPEPIPFAVLGRLAIDQAFQGRGIGRALVRDACLRLLQAAEIIGIRGMLLHAISEHAKAFYLALGFAPSPSEPMMLMVTLHDLTAAVEAGKPA